MNTLSQKEIDHLDQNGFVNLGQLLDANQLTRVNQLVEDILRREGDQAGSELFDSPFIKHPKEEGADRLADLVNKGSVFDQFYTHPKVLAAVSHVLKGDYKLSSLNYRAAKPGKGLQKLHVDWKVAVEENAYKVCNSIWLLDDFSIQNGATRLVPGTHRSGQLPESSMSDPFDSHPDEIVIQAPAGSVFLFNAHVWHGGTNNRTDQPRRAIHSYFCARDQPQQLDQKRYFQSETKNRLSDHAKYVLDV